MKTVVALATLLAGLGAAQPASAALITGTIAGTVSFGTDTLGLFGGGELVGKAISLSYSYDSDVFSPNAFGICGTTDSCNISRVSGALSIQTTIGTATRSDTSGPVAEVDFFSGGINGPTVSLYPTLPAQNGTNDFTILNLSLQQPGQLAGFTPANGGVTDRLSFTVDSDTEYLQFTPSVSAVPLPAAFPLFGAGLLLVATFGAVRRVRASRS